MVMRTFSVLALAAGAAAWEWERFSCGSNIAQACDYENRGPQDEAVSLFFQYEPVSGEASGGFACTGDDGTTYCSREWQAEASGSAGDCFFFLGAGQRFSCRGHGTVNLIDSQAAALSGAVLSGEASAALPCTGTRGCTYRNTAAVDEWVALAFTGDVGGSLMCTAGSLQVCDWAVADGAGGSSCNFVLPAGAELRCNGTADVTSAQALRLRTGVLAEAAPVELAWNCPNVTYPSPNLCDCVYKNPHAVDLVVSVGAAAVTEEFSSFHCGFGPSNVCAWGVNRNNQGNRGGCYFVLPAGAEFVCTMQYGAAGFTYSRALMLNTTLFPAQAAGVVAVGPEARLSVSGVDMLEEGRLRAAFAAWKEAHGRVYASAAEEARRFDNFREHVAVAGLKPRYNSLADLSRAEFEAMYKGCGREQHVAGPVWRPAVGVSVPTDVDWRQKNVVTPVKDQGQCGSCWTFSTTGAIESAWAIAGHPLVSLSEQNLVSCDNRDGNEGCNGGWPYKAIDYVAQSGIATEASYPYTSGGGAVAACTSGTRAAANVTGYANVAQDEESMAAYVAQGGPVSICVDAMTQLWWTYTDGIMTGCCNHVCDHAVLIVGYGEDAGRKYWLVKNSWGTQWGEGGYVRLERGTNQCGITTNPVFAKVGLSL